MKKHGSGIRIRFSILPEELDPDQDLFICRIYVSYVTLVVREPGGCSFSSFEYPFVRVSAELMKINF